jgi:hypothetical protein
MLSSRPRVDSGMSTVSLAGRKVETQGCGICHPLPHMPHTFSTTTGSIEVINSLSADKRTSTSVILCEDLPQEWGLCHFIMWESGDVDEALDVRLGARGCSVDWVQGFSPNLQPEYSQDVRRRIERYEN